MPLSDTERRILYSLGQQRLLEAYGKQQLRNAYMRQTLDPRDVGELPGNDQPSAFQRHRDLLEHGGFNANALRSIQTDMENQQAEADSNTTEQLDPIRAPMPLAIGGALRIARHYGKKYADGGEVDPETGIPVPDEQPSGAFDDPAAMAALSSKKHYEQPTPTVMQPDLQATQTGQQDVPEGYAVNDAGEIFHKQTGEVLKPTPRPSVLPVTRNQHGELEAAMPKVADIAGNMGAGWKVPVQGAEAVLGAGFVKGAKAAVGKGREALYDLPPEQVQNFQKITGTMGTHPGGVYADPANGERWYIKNTPTWDHAKNEKLAAELYKLAGVPTADVRLTTLNGKPAIASKWIQGEELNQFQGPYSDVHHLHEHLPADVWTSNYDAVGAGKNNVIVDDKGNAHRIDLGGALRYRAQGAPKTFWGSKVTEHETMLNPAKNTDASEVFNPKNYGPLTEDYFKFLQKQSATRIGDITNAPLADLVNKYGPDGAEAKGKLLHELIDRRDQVAQIYGGGFKPQVIKGGKAYPEAAELTGGIPFEPEKGMAGHIKLMNLNKSHSEDQFISTLKNYHASEVDMGKQITHKQSEKISKMLNETPASVLADKMKGLEEDQKSNIFSWMSPAKIANTKALGMVGADKAKQLIPDIDKINKGHSLYQVVNAIKNYTPTQSEVPFHAYNSIPKELGKFSPAEIMKEMEPLSLSQKMKIEQWLPESTKEKIEHLKEEAKQKKAGFVGQEYYDALEPLNYQKYRPKGSASLKNHFTPMQLNHIEGLGFNPDLALYKGGKFYESHPQSEQYPKTIIDPVTEAHKLSNPNEKALFLSHNPGIADVYGNLGGEYIANPKKTVAVDWQQATGEEGYSGYHMRKFIDAARKEGADMLIIKGVHDMGTHLPQDQYLVLNTNILRGPQAKFDKNKLHLRDPLASIAGGSLLGYGMLRGQEGDQQHYAKGGAAKVAKPVVNYSKGMPKSHCGICRFYHDRSCTKVQGKIDPAYWCRLFERADHAS